VSGRLSPLGGQVRLDGKSVTAQTPEAICRAGIAGTFQLARIPDALSALDNVAVAAMYGRRRLDVASARAEADQLLDRVGFAANRAAHADSLTYFDHKRIELARALACAPELLLLDEWLAGLNPTELEAGIDLVRSLRDEGRACQHIPKADAAVLRKVRRSMDIRKPPVLSRSSPAFTPVGWRENESQ
jgi:branched-chain amino acid transport system ATP-binding protein